MKFKIKHDIPGRMRVHLMMPHMSFEQADTLEYYLTQQSQVKKATVYERTADAVILYEGERSSLIKALARFHFDEVAVPETVIESSGRALNAQYKDQLITSVVLHYGKKLFLPLPVRAALNTIHSFKYISKGLKSLAARRIDVAILDATAIGVSIVRGDTETAGSVMFLLGVGEIMEEWTHKKAVNDLAQSMSLNVENVWQKVGDQEVLVSADKIQNGDFVVIHMGNVIPFDGCVVGGEGMVNQASLTGESVPVQKNDGGFVYAGTVLEEGELTIRVSQKDGSSRYEKIVAVIEETEKLKSSMESRSEHLADKLVPYTLAGTGLVWLLTRNTTKTLSVLMVDFSCALKLAMPITVLSAIREAQENHITVKGGKFLEAVSEAKTIVFDKTGTLTKATPTVREVVSFCDLNETELLRIAACLEEHFPHSMAKAIVNAAKERHIVHEEMHTRIEYIVAHGISSSINEQKVIVGSYHFVFEDEKCEIDPAYEERLGSIPNHYSTLYMAIDGKLAAIICIEDPVREEARDVIRDLHSLGFEKIVMMTGDSHRTAAAVAEKLGLDEYYAEVLPEQKADFVLKEKAAGRKVVMIGDGINDSPALSAADAGIAISDGAQLAREIADITISADSLDCLVTLKKISNAMVARVNGNYRSILMINGALIALGVGGIVQPTTSATLHNLSTIGISVKSMSKLL